MVKSSKDTRYAKDSVVTHDGIGFPCWALPDLMSFPEKFGLDAYDKVNSITFFGIFGLNCEGSALKLCFFFSLYNYLFAA